MMNRPIVVAVDGSEESLRAAEWAAVAARKHRAALRIVSVPDAPPRLYAVHVSEETAASALPGLAARALSAAVLRVRTAVSDLHVDVGLLDGRAPLAVAAAGTGAAMLVVGARGTGGFTAMTLGSVSRYASAHAPCPVVVVRDSPTASRHEVVVGIEDAEQSGDALAFGLDEAESRGVELTAVHAWTWFDTGLGISVGDAPAKAAASLSEALAPWRDKYPGVPLRSELVNGHAAWVLASYTARAELVVLGRRPACGGSGIAAIRQAVISHAKGPVAIVPAGV
jgi:nucleotide-binding universal stress UspA family protein